MKEIWKPIKDFDDYEISNKGRIRKILVPSTNPKGYKHIALLKNSKRIYKSIHRLVAEAFIPNEEELPVVNHKDENPSNNNVDNLEWCTHSYNQNYGTANERRVMGRKKPVAQYTLDGVFIRKYNSITDTKNYGFNIGKVWECCQNRRNQHKGFKWVYFI